MNILYLIQKKRKERLIKKLINVEKSLNKKTLSQYDVIKKDELICFMLSIELYSKSVNDPTNSNSLWMAFMIPLLFPYYNNNGKDFLEDVLKKAKEEAEK